MNHYKRTAEFEKEYRKLARKYRSLDRDIITFEKILSEFPTGSGKKFTIIHSGEDTKIIKARLMCQALRDSSLRIIYAYHKKEITLVYIELYFKGDKANEDYERVKEYIKDSRKAA